MQKSIIKLTNAELELISDPGVSILKQNALRKITELFHQSGQYLQSIYPSGNSNYKITRGENYLLHPYIVVDYPKINNMDFRVLYRSMFWWGNYFAFEFMLKRELFTGHFEVLKEEADVYLLTGKDLWNNDVNSDEYTKLDQVSSIDNNDTSHIKLVKIHPLSSYESMPEEAHRYYALCSQLVSSEQKKGG